MNHFYSNLKLVLVALFAFMGMSVWAEDVTDVLDRAFTGVSGTSYTDFSDKSSQSSAVYAGQCAGGNESIQLRSNNNNSGVVTTASGGTVKKIVVTWNENTNAARVLNVYGSNTAYTAATDLYSTDNQGTLIGTLKCEDATNGVSTLEVSDSYTFIGFRSASGAMYLTSVAITWSTGSSAPVIAKPTLPASTTFFGSMTVEISASDGLGIFYTTDGTDPTPNSTAYTAPLEISATTTVKAIAVQSTNGAVSAVASATYTAGPVYASLAEANKAATTSRVVSQITLTDALVTFISGSNTYVQDATGGFLIYGTTDLTVGDIVNGTVQGQLYLYNGLPEIANPTLEVNVVSSNNMVKPTVVNAAELAANPLDYVSQYVAVQNASFAEDVATSEKTNINFTVGETSLVLRNNFTVDIDVKAGKAYYVVGLVTVYNATVQLYPTDAHDVGLMPETYGTNLDFESSAAVTTGICTYARDMANNSTTFFGAQPVEGWTVYNVSDNQAPTSGNSRGELDQKAAGVFEYGSAAWLGGKNYIAPAAGPEGSTGSHCLGLISVWGGENAVIKYTQEIQLEAGSYDMEIPVYNGAGTNALTANYIGYIDANGVEHFAQTTQYPVGEWTEESFVIMLTEPATITVCLGIQNGSGSGAAPHLFVDGVNIVKLETEDALRIQLANDLYSATIATRDLIIGEGIFMIPQEAQVAYEQVYQNADATAKNESATAEELQAAIDNLAQAIQTLKAAVTLPDPAKKYSIQLKDGLNYMTLDSGTKLAAEPVGLSFVAVDGGYAITNGTEYVACTGTGNNNWSMAASETAYAWTIAPLADGYYSIAKVSAPADHIGVDNTGAGSACYANKAVSDKALWGIVEFTEQPEEPVDVTNLIKNPAYLENGYDGWTYSENGFKTRTYEAPMNLITYSGNADFEVSQVIENVPAGLYKLTVSAFYRAGSLDAEKALIEAGEELPKYLSMYATVAASEDTYSTKVMNLSEGATDVAYGDGTTTLANGKFVPNSANESRAWYIAGEYANDVLFNVFEDGSAVTIGVKKAPSLESDYAPIGAWKLVRLGDADATAATPDEKPVVPGDLQPGDDATAYIVNPSFETGDLTGWTVGSSSDTGVRENSNATYHTEGCDGAYLFNTWWQGIPITQTIQGLPNGLYELKALMANNAGDGNEDKPCLYLTANGQHSEAVASGNAGVFVENSIQFYVTDGTAVIGAIGGNGDGSFTENGYYWYKVDNFRLTYVSALPSIDEIEIPEGKMSLEAQNGIAAAQQAQDAIALIEAVKVAEASVAAYADAAKAIEAAKAIKEGTNVATEEATTTFADAIAAIETAYDGGTLADTDAKAAGATLGTIVTEWRQGTEGAAVKFMESAYSLNAFDQPLYINTWSVEGESDGSEFKVPFYEYFVANDQTLAANSFSTTIEGLKPGIYDVTALIRVQPTNGQDTPSGVTFSANDGEAVDATAEATAYGDRLFLKEVATQATVGEDGKLVININVEEGSNAHWLSFKNVKYAAAPTDPYEDALAAIQDGANYRIFTEINGEKYYVTEGGLLSAISDDGGIFTFNKKENTGNKYKQYGYQIDSGSKRFTNPPLANNVANLNPGTFATTTNNRNDWETQVLFLQDGKYAIRSCNVPDGTSSWNDAGRTYWTFAVEDVKPQYTYDPTYVWQLEGPLSIINVAYQLYEADGETTVGNPVTKKQEANSAVNIPSDFTNIAYYDYIVEGEIADVDCTIKVFRSMKNGVVHQLSDLSNDKAYTIRCNRGALLTSDDHLASTAHSSLTVAAPAEFAIISYEDNYYLYSIADGKFVTFDSTLSSEGARGPLATMPTHGTDDALKLEPKTDPYFLTYFTAGGTNYGLNTNGNDPYGYVINTWMTADEGNQYYIIESGEFDPTDALAALDAYFHPSFFVTYVVKDAEGTELFTSEPQPARSGDHITELPSAFQRAFMEYSDIDVTVAEQETTVEVTATWNGPIAVAADFADITWQNMYINRGDDNHWYLYNSGDANESFKQNPAEEDLASDEYQWGFVGNAYEGLKMYNKATGESQTLTNGATVAMADGEFVWDVLAENQGGILIGVSAGYLNQSGGATATKLALWGSATDMGSTFYVSEVPGISAQDVLEKEIANAEALAEEAQNPEAYDQETVADDLATLQEAIETAKSKLGTTDDEMTAAAETLKEAEDAFKSALTAINGINADQINGTIYDLSGRKIQKVQRGGVYIVNGKKVAFK